MPGAVARSEACPLGMHVAPSSIACPSHSFVEIWSRKNFYGHSPLPLIQEEQLSVTGEIMCTKYW